jgi:hypothetical protein
MNLVVEVPALLELVQEFQPEFSEFPNGAKLPYGEGWLDFYNIITCTTRPQWPGQDPAKMQVWYTYSNVNLRILFCHT